MSKKVLYNMYYTFSFFCSMRLYKYEISFLPELCSYISETNLAAAPVPKTLFGMKMSKAIDTIWNKNDIYVLQKVKKYFFKVDFEYVPRFRFRIFLYFWNLHKKSYNNWKRKIYILYFFVFCSMGLDNVKLRFWKKILYIIRFHFLFYGVWNFVFVGKIIYIIYYTFFVFCSMRPHTSMKFRFCQKSIIVFSNLN